MNDMLYTFSANYTSIHLRLCYNDLRFNVRIAISYMKCLADRFQLKIREGKTKRKKPPHF
jgi:hypothetical protein